MPDNEALAPTIAGTTADDDVYRIREGFIPQLKARYPLYIIGFAGALALVSILAGVAIGWTAKGQDEDARRERYDFAKSVAAVGLAFSGTMLGIGSTALQIGGSEQPPSHANKPLPSGNNESNTPTVQLAKTAPDTYEGTEIEPTTQPTQEGAKSWSSGEGFGFLRNSSEYDAEMALVNMRRIQADVEQALDGLPKVGGDS